MVQTGKTKVGVDTLELPLVTCIIVIDELPKNPGRDLLRWVIPNGLAQKNNLIRTPLPGLGVLALGGEGRP